MKRRLPPFPSDAKGAVVQIRRGARAIASASATFVSESERYTYFKLGKFPCTPGQLRRTAMRRGMVRKHIERWQDRLDELLAFAVSEELYSSVRRLAACNSKVFELCDRIPRKGHWPGDEWCQRLGDVAREIGGKKQ